MDNHQQEPISPHERLARDFERWQKEYYDDVDALFAKEDKNSGKVAFSLWDQRFIDFLQESAPSLLAIYQNTVRSAGVAYYPGTK